MLLVETNLGQLAELPGLFLNVVVNSCVFRKFFLCYCQGKRLMKRDETAENTRICRVNESKKAVYIKIFFHILT